MKDPGGSYAMDGNDPMTQYYLQMTDDAVNQQQQQQQQQQSDRGSSGPHSSSSSHVVEAALQILRSTTSGELYEGDDELDEDTTLAQSQTGPEDTEGEPEAEPIDVANGNTGDTESDDEVEVLGVSVDTEEAAVDFVHVHLEHLPSGDDLQADPMSGPQYGLSTDGDGSNNNNDENGNGPIPTRFTYYRKFASQGSPSLQKTASNGNTNDGNQHPHLETVSPSMEESRAPSTVDPRSERTHLTSIGDSIRAIRGEKIPCNGYPRRHPSHQLQLPPNNNNGLQRQKALQGDLVYACNTETSHKGQDTSTVPYLSQQATGQLSRDSSRFNTDDEQELQNNFDFVNMTVSHPLHSSASAVDEGKQKQGIMMMQTTQSSNNDGDYEPPSISECPTQNTVEANRNDSTPDAKEVQFSASGDGRYESGSDAMDIDYTNSQAISRTCTSDDETRISLWTTPKETKEHRQERLLRHREKKFRMSLLQTMQHNTRANFCTIFLLGVAMATLVLLIVAKLTSNSREDMYYDEDEDKHFVVTNNERLLTIEVLAFGLIIVLLLGSVCYLGVTTYDTKNSLVRAVKHEDACLANASARRKQPTYKAPYVQDGSHNRKRYSAGRSSRLETVDTHEDPAADNNDQQQPDTTGADYEDYPNQTFSIVSSGTGTDRSHGEDDQELISMEEADRMYRELEDRAVCSCSPISLHASTDELEMQTDDEEEGRKHRRRRQNEESLAGKSSTARKGVASALP